MSEAISELSQRRRIAEGIRRLRIIMITVPALFAAVTYLFVSNFDYDQLAYRFGLNRDLMLLGSIGLLAISGLFAILHYLQTGFRVNTISGTIVPEPQRAAESYLQAETTEAVLRHEDEIAVLRAELHQTRLDFGGVDAQSRADLIDQIKAGLRDEASTAILEEIRKKSEIAEARSAQAYNMAKHFEESRSRLQKELEALGWRGNLNLALGATTTIIGIGLLGFNVFAETNSANDLWTLASHFVPRLALVLLIEVFAFFFLSLYKSNLGEIKYFQNELTNIELKQIALGSAIAAKDTTVLSEVIGKLAATERNHILSKDQTTIELEKVRIDRDSQNTLAKAMAEFFQKKG